MPLNMLMRTDACRIWQRERVEHSAVQQYIILLVMQWYIIYAMICDVYAVRCRCADAARGAGCSLHVREAFGSVGTIVGALY